MSHSKDLGNLRNLDAAAATDTASIAGHRGLEVAGVGDRRLGLVELGQFGLDDRDDHGHIQQGNQRKVLGRHVLQRQLADLQADDNGDGGLGTGFWGRRH